MRRSQKYFCHHATKNFIQQLTQTILVKGLQKFHSVHQNMCVCARACVCWVACSPHSSEAERQKGQWPHFTRGASGGMQSRVIDSGGEEAQPASQPWFWQVDLTEGPTLTSRPTVSNHQVVCRVIKQLRDAVVPGLCLDNMRVWWEQKPIKTNSPKS